MLTQENRLRRRKDFRYVYARGRSAATPLLSLIQVKSGPPGCLRVGFSVSKKVGHAVVRNKVKRRLRAAFREELPNVKKNHKLIFVARPSAAQADYATLKRDMQYLLRRAGLVNGEAKP